jgi:molecular chaperone GrpE
MKKTTSLFYLVGSVEKYFKNNWPPTISRNCFKGKGDSMLNFDEEIKKFEKMLPVAEENNADTGSEKVIDFQTLMARFEKLTKVYYQVAQDISVLKDELLSRSREVGTKNEEIDQLRKTNLENAKQLETTLLAMVGFAGVLDRSLSTAQESKNVAVVDLIAQLNRELEAQFKKIGIVEINSVDDKFDLALHDVISAVEKEGRQKFALLQIVERGFVYAGKVLKKAQVISAK